MNINKDNFQTFYSEISCCQDITLDDSLETDDIVKILEDVHKYERETDKVIDILASNLQFEKRIEIVRYALSSDDITNPTIIANILFLLRNYNSFSDSFFQDEKTLFNNMTEFLDFKIKLKLELENFIKKLATWYISTILSMHKVEINQFDEVMIMPRTIMSVILSTDMFTLSGICSKYKFKEDFTPMIVDNAFEIIGELTRKNNFISEMYVDIIKELKTKNDRKG